MDDPIQIPLYRHDGTVRAYALVDAVDAEQAGHRWCLNSPGYACRQVALRKVYLHREILGLTFGDGLKGDHRNGDGLDNRRSNLRVVTNAENGQNRASQKGSSKHRGVYWDKGDRRWKARAKLAGRTHCIGSFISEEEAAEAARAFRLAHMPFTAER